MRKGLRYLACEGESMKELLSEVAPLKQPVILKKEQPQKNYKLVKDKPVFIGFLEMFTIESNWYDSLGRNRKGSTFALQSLLELGINPFECTIV